MSNDFQREVIFEFIQNGTFMKVVAVDVATGLEVSTIAPSSLTKVQLERHALAKLKYVLGKKNAGAEKSFSDPAEGFYDGGKNV